jgi:hypothetical protein
MSEAKATARPWSDEERAIRFYIGCATPLPLKCNLCSKYNRGIGLDYCLFSNWKNTLIVNARANESWNNDGTGKHNDCTR